MCDVPSLGLETGEWRVGAGDWEPKPVWTAMDRVRSSVRAAGSVILWVMCHLWDWRLENRDWEPETVSPMV